MATLTKKRKLAEAKIQYNKAYPLGEAVRLLKEITFTKFDASVDVAIRLGVDPTKSEQVVRGSVSLPHGTGKKVRVLVLCPPDKEDEAQKAGADFVGLDEYIRKIEEGWVDVDVVVATPSVMPKIGKLGKILGPRNLMPNPKSGTVTEDVVKAVREIKRGKINFRVDKYGIIHAAIGKVSFSVEQLQENAMELIRTVARMKPTSAKGIYMKSVHISSTMSPSLLIDLKSIGLS